MATDSARYVSRHYWQLPLFAVGVLCAAGAWIQFPPTPESPADRYRRDLSQLKSTIDRKPIDVARIQALLPVVEAGLEQFPDSAPVANYVLGSGYLVVAESTPGEATLWKQAARYLDQTATTHLTDLADQQRLPYRQAKARIAIGRVEPRLLQVLQAVPPGEDAEGELRRLLAEAHLQQTPPDLKRAVKELTAYLGGPSRIPAPLQSQYKLKLGQMHLQLNETDKGRARLQDIGPSAAPEVLAQARVALAKLASSENQWAESVKLFEEALALAELPTDQRGAIFYQLGLDLLQLKRVPEATSYLEKATATSGSVASAAAIKLAEMSLRDPQAKGQRGSAVERLETAMRELPAGQRFENPLVTLNQVQATFEEAIQTAMNEGDFATAVRAAAAYEAVAPEGRDREKRAAIQAAWAGQLLKQPGQQALAKEKFRAAAEDYAGLAESYPTVAGKADLLQRATECFRNAGEEPAAVKTAEQLTLLSGAPLDNVAQAWIDLAEIKIGNKQYPDGVSLLQKAVTSGTPVAAKARVKLALTYLDLGRAGQKVADTLAAKSEAAGQIDFAQKVLAEVANTPAEGAIEQAAQQLALFELGKFQLQQSNLADAEARFRQFIQSYPAVPLAGQVKLYLGSCLLLLARGDHQGGQMPADADRKLAEAHKLFESLADSSDQFLRTHADIRLANTTLLMRRYDEMPTLCEKLASRYAGQVEELIILSMLYTAYRKVDRLEQAARTLSRMEGVYSKLSDADFPGGAEEYTRAYWKTSWFAALSSK